MDYETHYQVVDREERGINKPRYRIRIVKYYGNFGGEVTVILYIKNINFNSIVTPLILINSLKNKVQKKDPPLLMPQTLE